MKKTIALLLALCMMIALLAGCGNKETNENSNPTPATNNTEQNNDEKGNGEQADEDDQPGTEPLAAAEIHLYAAASMENAFTEIIEMYKQVQPNITVTGNYDSSGKLLTAIEEANGTDIDIFFSAGKKQVTTLDETDGLVVEGSVVDLLGNALCLVTYNGSDTKVTGWDNLGDAANMALCDGTVPAGQYTRKLLVAKGILPEAEDVNAYTSEEISQALGGLEINEAENVSAAASFVVEHSNEITTCYYTDYYSYKNQLTIIDMDEKGEFTGAITYPVCQVKNPNADEALLAATEDFLNYIQSDEILDVFAEYCFVVNG